MDSGMGPDTGQGSSVPPGWYVDQFGVNRWWSGTEWGQSESEWQVTNAATTQFGQHPGQFGQYPGSPAQSPRYPVAGQYQGFSPPPPPPPWGTWTWADGSPIDIASLPPYDPGKKLVVGLLGILLGGLGIHKFVLGLTTEGVITILLNLVCIGGLIGFVEGIIYLTKSDQEFYWTYVVGKKPWF